MSLENDDILIWSDLNAAQREGCKAIASSSLFGFLCVFFQLIQAQKFNKNWHHVYACSVAEKVFNRQIKRLIFNCAPGSTKTEIWSIHFVAWSIAKSAEVGSSSRWLPTSYSADLVDENTSRVREIILSEAFQWMWPMVPSKYIFQKNNWMFHAADNQKHRMFGTSIFGQLTGRRAGYMTDGFSGALIADDPLPPREENRGKGVERSNKSMNRIVRSRLAHNEVPLILIQQRIQKGDTTDFLVSDKSPDDYDQVIIPAMIDLEYVKTLDENTQVALVDDTGFDGTKCSYWSEKDPTSVLKAIEKADPYLYNSQYQQRPQDAFLEGIIWKLEIDTMIADNRVGRIPIEPGLKVLTFWDWGMHDMTAIWLVQILGKEVRLIASYANANQNLEHYLNWLSDFKEQYNIRYMHKGHYFPHDFNIRESEGKTRLTKAKELGYDGRIVPVTKSKSASINAVRSLFPYLHVDTERNVKGEQKDKGGWNGIKNYRREWDADNEVFSKTPVHDWCSHYADALQGLGMTWRDSLGLNVKETKQINRQQNSGGWLGN